MRDNRAFEIGTGFFVLLGFAALLFLTTQLPTNGLRLGPTKAGYTITARFENIGDLKTGSPVTMAGVRIGVVQLIKFDPQDYKAVVTMRLDPQYNQIPRTVSRAFRRRASWAASTSASVPAVQKPT